VAAALVGCCAGPSVESSVLIGQEQSLPSEPYSTGRPFTTEAGRLLLNDIPGPRGSGIAVPAREHSSGRDRAACGSKPLLRGQAPRLYVISRGKLDCSAVASDLSTGEATRRARGRYGVFRVPGAWLEPTGPHFSHSVIYATQVSSRNLDSFEKTYAGGSRDASDYPPEETSSESEHALNLAGCWRSVQAGGYVQQERSLYCYFDARRARLSRNVWPGWNAGNPKLGNQYSFKRWGQGVRVHTLQTVKIDLVRRARIVGTPDAGVATGLDADGQSDRSRFWVVGTIFF
jgi:hypothetical protein